MSESIASTLAPRGAVDLAPLFGGAHPIVEVQARETVPFVTFAQPKRTDEWAKLRLLFPDIEEGHQVMVHSDPKFPWVRLQPMRFSLLAAKQYWCKEDMTGSVLQTFTEDGPDRRERIECALVLYLQGGAVACLCAPKTTKCPVFQQASQQLKLSSEEATAELWMKQSDAHGHAVVAAAKLFGPGPDAAFARFFVTVGLGHRTSRTGPGKGLPYAYTTGTVAPTGLSEWKALGELAGSEDGLAALRKCIDHWRNRCNDLEAKIAR